MGQTFGQKAVGVVVTQGLENTQVDKVTEVKTTFAKIIDTVNDIEVITALTSTNLQTAPGSGVI